MIMCLHILQPVARLYGRYKNGLTPWRKRGVKVKTKFLFAYNTRIFTFWSEEWKSAEDWLMHIEENLLKLKARAKRGDDFAKWDIMVRNGLFGKAKALLTIEEHGAGKQLIRFRCTPVITLRGLIILFLFLGFLLASIITNEMAVVVLAAIISFFFLLIMTLDRSRSINSLYSAFRMACRKEETPKEKPKFRSIIKSRTVEKFQPANVLQYGETVFHKYYVKIFSHRKEI